MNFKNIKIDKRIPLAIGAVALAYSIKHVVFKVEPGFTALKFNIFSGTGNKHFREGYHFLIPFVERPIIYDCRMKNNNLTCVCGTKGKPY
jgi:hypothetical protein